MQLQYVRNNTTIQENVSVIKSKTSTPDPGVKNEGFNHTERNSS